jgi:hypothetical protein
MIYRELAVLGLAVIPLAAQAPSGCGSATSASYAGDGNTQFGNGGVDFVNQGSSGKLKFGVTYKAVAENSQQRTNCKWHIYSVDAHNKIVYESKSSDYLHAKINVEEPTRVRVWLKSVNCGLWKPA